MAKYLPLPTVATGIIYLFALARLFYWKHRLRKAVKVSERLHSEIARVSMEARREQ